jgi:hypothetical protein
VSRAGESVIVSMNASAARTRGVTGAVRQSARTASTTAPVPNAFDATAPWAFVQNGH